jgi:hypothetical protein
MKKILYPLTLLMAVFALPSCDSAEDDGESPASMPADGVIRISARVAETAATRAEISYTGDFALYIGPTEVTNDFSYNNVYFSRENGAWAPQSGQTLHWMSSRVPYSYSAYAPVHGEDGEGISSGADGVDDRIPYNIGSEDLEDLLWTGVPASAGRTAPDLVNEDGKLELVFEHKYCQVNVELTIGNALYTISHNQDYSSCPVKYVTLTDPQGQGLFNVRTGEFEEGTSATVDLTPSEINDENYTAATSTTSGHYVTTTQYMTSGVHEVTVGISRTEGDPTAVAYSYTLPARHYEGGKVYTLKIKVGESIVNFSGVKVRNWRNLEEVDSDLPNGTTVRMSEDLGGSYMDYRSDGDNLYASSANYFVSWPEDDATSKVIRAVVNSNKAYYLSYVGLDIPSDQSSSTQAADFLAFVGEITRDPMADDPYAAGFRFEHLTSQVNVQIASASEKYADCVFDVRVYSYPVLYDSYDVTNNYAIYVIPSLKYDDKESYMALTGGMLEVTPMNSNSMKIGTTATCLVAPTPACPTQSFIKVQPKDASGSAVGDALYLTGIPKLEYGYSYTFRLSVTEDGVAVVE